VSLRKDFFSPVRPWSTANLLCSTNNLMPLMDHHKSFSSPWLNECLWKQV